MFAMLDALQVHFLVPNLVMIWEREWVKGPKLENLQKMSFLPHMDDTDRAKIGMDAHTYLGLGMCS